jgi:hypothetical protein
MRGKSEVFLNPRLSYGGGDYRRAEEKRMSVDGWDEGVKRR